MKIGMIGLGFMGATHVEAFLKIEGVSIAAVCSNNPRALEGDLTEVGGNLPRGAGKYDFSQAHKFTDWHDLIQDPDVEAVDICLPTDLHTPVALAAIAAGKHVLCEKPMSLTGAQCDQMTAAARKKGVILMIGQVLRFWPEYNYLEQFIRSGEYGAVKAATFVRRCAVPDWSKWLLDDSRAGGPVLDLLVHDIDQAIQKFGVPSKISAKSLGGIDTISATFTYPKGPEVRIQGGWFESGTPFAMGFQVVAERAELELAPDGLRLNDQSGTSLPIKPEGPDAYAAEVGYFVECCRTGKWPERCPPEDSARGVKLALALKESRAEGGRQIQIDF